MTAAIWVATTLGAAIGDCPVPAPGSESPVELCEVSGLTVREAIERAESVSPAFEDAAVAVDEARAEHWAALARMLPRWQLSASYRRLSNVDNPPLFPPVLQSGCREGSRTNRGRILAAQPCG
ncbi:MAG: hypothetical protein AAF219_02730 [Myxococcota bacterium]